MQHIIQEELKRFQIFKQQVVFEQKEIVEENNQMFCDGFPIFDTDGKLLPQTETWLNVGYNIKHAQSKCLSNLFPYHFEFRGFLFHSLEAVFQSLKFKNPTEQRFVFHYDGLNAYYIQTASMYDWKKTGILYWQGEPIIRQSQAYEYFIDEVYISALQNPLYRHVLYQVQKYILHSIGKDNPNETVFTRFEFEKQLNLLNRFLRSE